MRTRPAFSIAELLVSLVLLAVGVAASVRAASAVARLEGDARLRRALANAVQARLDSLSTHPCVAAQHGTASVAGLSEAWQATTDGERWRVDIRIGAPARAALARHYALTVPCPP